MSDDPPFLTVINAPNGHVVSLMEFDKTQDQYVAGKSSRPYSARIDALRYAVLWAERDGLEIR